MCGIIGFTNSIDQLASIQIIKKGIELIKHRGPDDNGYFYHPNVCLGHTRLKVIDLSSNAAQPMKSAEEKIVLVFNGEIFNYNDIRKELLKQKKINFRSDSDTEVILNAYIHWGVFCFDLFNGMFSIAIVDLNNNKLIIARDRFGIKPLYYTTINNQFVFASELKFFYTFQDFVSKLNETALFETLAYRSLAGEKTLLENVSLLSPATFAEIDLNVKSEIKMEKTCYWDLKQDTNFSMNYKDAKQHIIYLLNDSIRLRKISDVPVGLLLSGGIDSSLVAAFDRDKDSKKIQSFSVGFKEQSFDESKYFSYVANKYGISNKTYIFSLSDITDSFEKCIWHLEEPINHPHTPLFFLISNHIKKYVTVILSGEASDEIFAGYSRYTRTLNEQLSSEKNKLETIVQSSILMRYNIINKLIKNRFTLDFEKSRKALIDNKQSMSNLQQLQYYDLKTYLPSLLLRLDKMTMAFALEARIPFIDYRLVEFAFALPDSYKINGVNTKEILKNIALSYFPKSFVYRPKVGFRTPFRQWFRNDPYFKKIIMKDSPINDFINMKYVSATADKFFNGDDSFDCSDVVWSVLTLKVWSQLFLKN